jgi:hypothetical protein
MLDSLEPRRYQSAVLLGPRSVAHPSPRPGRREQGWGAPILPSRVFPVGVGNEDLAQGEENATRNGSPDLPVQNQGSQQVSPQSAKPGVGAVVCFAGVAQLVEHLFCKQVVRGSIPRASSAAHLGGACVSVVSKVSESCPSGQREQAVNLPAYAYAGSNPALSTLIPSRGAPQVFGSLARSLPGMRPGTNHRVGRSTKPVRRVSRPAGVAQLVERQPSKLNVESSSLFSRSTASCHAIVTVTAHLAQLVEHVLGKDEVTSSNLVVGSKH